jgi:hypothetical protein
VKIEHYDHDRDGISIATLEELGFAYMKMYGATGVDETHAKPMGYDETGTVSSQIPGIAVNTQSSNYANHTYGMLDDATKEIGHHGFLVDAETMAAVLYDFATHPELRDAVHTEFTGVQSLFGQYENALEKAYPKPEVNVPE